MMSEIQPTTGADPSSTPDDVRVRRREHHIDAMLEQSFPASDPPGWTLGVATPQAHDSRGTVHPHQQEQSMEPSIYPQSTSNLARKRHELAPAVGDAFKAFSEAVFADGALPGVTKQLIAVAVAHVTQCPYCIKGHTRSALRHGASEQQIMEAIWVAAEMRAGGAYAHSILALDTMKHSHPASAEKEGPA
jgi:AhpD family alkylhydroperoxidase